MNGLAGLPRQLAHHFREDARAGFFAAALAVIAEHVGLLAILTKLSLLVVANIAVQPADSLTDQGPVVLYLTESHWQDRYLERSPLNRCLLADDLGTMLQRQPRTLTVDFDLSPAALDSEPSCQRQLDALLDQHGSTLVLLAPMKVSSDRLVGLKKAWMQARCSAGVAFGDGTLEESLGVVIDAHPDDNSLASMVAKRSEGTICKDLSTLAGAEQWLKKTETPREETEEALPINFASASQQLSTLAMDDPALANIRNWHQRDVLFGGFYGASKDDSFLTPLGALPGIAVHAARVVTQQHPVTSPPHGVGVTIDILIAFLFSIGITLFWHLYAHFQIRGVGFRREYGALMVTGFLIFYSALVYLFFALAADLFAVGILIAPLLIAASMLIDGFITGPIAATIDVAKVPREPYVTSGKFCVFIGLLGAIGLCAATLHVGSAALMAVVLALIAVPLDRYLSSSIAEAHHAHQAHHSQPDATTPRVGLGVLWLLVFAALLFAASMDWLLPLSRWFTTAFVAVLGLMCLMLAVGLVIGLHRPQRRHAPPGTTGTHRLLGLLGLRLGSGARPAGPGLAIYLIRQTLFWLTMCYATVLLVSH
ncbi:hypothetical protein [Actimicrobium antarcticum]|uniref:CHASE2 domain-containing protein n=1 Tax=Actimicrobium antarcticum TaxID=1051899 RepID=A0ABP7TV96_9BURK